MFGKSSVPSNEVAQHKRMAGAQMKGNFGVKPLPPCKGPITPR